MLDLASTLTMIELEFCCFEDFSDSFIGEKIKNYLLPLKICLNSELNHLGRANLFLFEYFCCICNCNFL